MSDENKIIIDDDWKAQAEKEKEELAAEAEAESAQMGEAPEATLLGHFESLAVQAMMALGLVEHPAMKGQRMMDPIQAKYLIDTLDMLKEKTEGNRSNEEEEYITKLMPDLKMTYVEVVNAVAQAQSEEAAKAGGEAGAGDGPSIVTP